MFQIVNRIDVIMQQYIVLHVLNTFIDLILYMLEFKYICFTSITFAVVLLMNQTFKNTCMFKEYSLFLSANN